MFSALTAKERALLILQAWKEDREEDPQIRWTMPPEQVLEFNHYIFLMNTVNIELGTLLSYISSLIDQLSVRLGWLQTIELCSMVISGLGGFIALCTKEPVTESEYEEHVRQAREETVPASQLAETLAERALEGTDAASEEGPQWKRTVREKEREIERLVDEGVLTGRRRGKRLLVNTPPSMIGWGSRCLCTPTGGATTRSSPMLRPGRCSSCGRSESTPKRCWSTLPAIPILNGLT